MAIKGKKKSQSRGSQGHRRPAQPPRPAVGSSQRVPWYKDTTWQVIGSVLFVLLLGIGWWAISTAQSNSKELEQRQENLQSYTDSLAALLQTFRGGSVEMATASSGTDYEALTAQSKRWTALFEVAQKQAAQIQPPGSMTEAHQLFVRTVILLRSAAQTYGLVPQLEGQDQEDLLVRAAEARDSANSIWLTGVALLDAQRTDAE